MAAVATLMYDVCIPFYAFRQMTYPSWLFNPISLRNNTSLTRKILTLVKPWVGSANCQFLSPRWSFVLFVSLKIVLGRRKGPTRHAFHLRNTFGLFDHIGQGFNGWIPKSTLDPYQFLFCLHRYDRVNRCTNMGKEVISEAHLLFTATHCGLWLVSVVIYKIL